MLLGVQKLQKQRQFYFERHWLQQEGFLEVVKTRWQDTRSKIPPGTSAINVWHTCISSLRNFLKGWGRNQRGEFKRKKKDIMDQIEQIDMEAEKGELTEQRWDQ